ncbi:MAG TPA: AAA family ATPase [Baekduia sp.]|uniref:helix-turn-helix transcriptional regulator n=1 Tax=Baekduia sp. TaxID=2600305 RepID=UPI002D10694F|nr:AAA family ATPase [Baekduia sp.]HMJ36964.1 AAA family ATPase [Baekduia sp.]
MSGLLERERELSELDALAREACAGTGRLAVLEAAAGLGKTRLLQAARESGRRAGMRVLAARATELERDFPFALVRQLFEPALTALDEPAREALLHGAVGPARGALGLPAESGTPADLAADAFAVLHGLYWLTAAFAEQQPLLLAVDDAHWSDAASLDFVRFLVPRLEELPVLLVLTCRPNEAGAERSLARIATDSVARRLTPHALTPQGAAALLAGTLERPPEEAFTATCHEVSGGNPFLLCELARTLAEEEIDPAAEQASRVRELAPERVTRTVQVRLARLSPEARAVARAVVVLGDGADGRLAAELAELDEPAVARGADELRAAAILDQDATLRFIHPLVRTALDAELPTGERAAAHARAAELLRARGASAELLAAHLVATEARGERATTETLLEAGRAALASGAPRSAHTYLTRALREPAPDDLRPAILIAIVNAGIRLPDRALFAATLPALTEELDRGPDLQVRWGIRVSMWMILSGHAGHAVRFLERGIEIASARGDVESAFRMEAQLSAIQQQPLPVWRARLSGYVDQIPPDSVSGRLAAALTAEWAAFDGTAADAVAAARRALSHDGRIFVEQPELFAPGRAMLALVLADELEVAWRGAEQALAHARRRSATPELVSAWWHSGFVAWAYGDLAAAEADIRQALAAARLGRMRFAEPPLGAVLASLLLARGERDAAEAELVTSGMTGEIPDAVWISLALFPRGQLRFEQGRFEEAAADFLQAERLSICWGAIGIPAPPARILAALALAAKGDREHARPLAEAALAHARHFGAPTLVSRALRASAMTLDGASRLAALEEAVAVLDGSPARLVRAEALADLGAALRRLRRDVDARPPLREALELARRCGAVGLAKVAFDELAATGERVRRYTPIGVESLTPSQRRVAELAASGMTNRQIAQTLFLTVKTIESHLAAAYDNLGIRSRQQLPAALSRQPSRGS